MRISDWSSDVCSSDLLRDVHAGEAEFAGQLPPDRLVIAVLGLHQAADFRRGRPAFEEAPQDRPKLDLPVRECELHPLSSFPGISSDVQTTAQAARNTKPGLQPCGETQDRQSVG